MIKQLICILVVLMSANVWAAIPTAEGLFRNGSNHDLDGNIALVDIVITEVENKKFMESTPVVNSLLSSEGTEAVIERNLMGPRYLRFIFDSNDKGFKLLQLDYSSSTHSDANVTGAYASTSLRGKLNDEGYVERQLFYSILSMYSLNRSDEMADFLKKYCPEFKRNAEIINKEKKELYDRYKKYLAAIGSDSSLVEKLDNPMKPKNEDEQKRVAELLTSKMYLGGEEVGLVKRGDGFQWKVEFKNFLAYFSNHDHRLRSLNFDIPGATVSVNADNYVLYNGVHSLPKTFMLKQRDGRLFRVQITDYKNFSSPEYYSKKLGEHKDKIKSAQVGEALPPTMFLY